MQISLPRNRVLLLSVVMEQAAKRLFPGALKQAMLNTVSQLNKLITDHDNQSKA